MKITLVGILASFLFLISCGDQQMNKTSKTTTMDKEESTVPPKLLRHVVLFNFNDKATSDKLKLIETEFASLKDKISEIHSFEWGTNNSPEGLDKGMTHCFLVTFLSEEDRDKYLPHPEHQAFVDLIGPYIEDVTVVDYWIEK